MKQKVNYRKRKMDFYHIKYDPNYCPSYPHGIFESKFFKKNLEIDLFDLMRFLGLDFMNWFIL